MRDQRARQQTLADDRARMKRVTERAGVCAGFVIYVLVIAVGAVALAGAVGLINNVSELLTIGMP
jgi:hypothetical protein